jgi:uncharacterized RDD family membrane protein YckC
MATCPNCLGIGEIEGPNWVFYNQRTKKKCPSCNGTGTVNNAYSNWPRCLKCDGWGNQRPLATSRQCTVCKGSGINFSGEEATGLIRLGAAFTDMLLSIVISLYIVLIIWTFSGDLNTLDFTGSPWLIWPPCYILLVFPLAAIKGQTPGKMLFKIKVVNSVDDKPGPLRTILREAIKLLLIVVAMPFIGIFIFFAIFWRSIPDRITDTEVVESGSIHDDTRNLLAILMLCLGIPSSITLIIFLALSLNA